MGRKFLRSVFFIKIILISTFLYFIHSNLLFATNFNFNNTSGDNDWAKSVNWDPYGLPTKSDDVFIWVNVTNISKGSASVNSATFMDTAIWDANSRNLILSVVTNATFNESSINKGIIVANNTFFNHNSSNNATVYGNAFFNNNSCNVGNVYGNAIINTTYYSGTLPTNGTLIINGTKYWGGRINGTVYGSDGSLIKNYVFRDSSCNQFGTINGEVIFNNNSYNNYGTINGNATFNNKSSNYGTINGNATFNTTYYSGTLPTNGTLIINGTKEWRGRINGTVYGSDGSLIKNYVFRDSSYNYGTINGEVIFNNNSYNWGTINGNATFNTTYYSGTLPTNGTLIINGTKYWTGEINGTVYGSDGSLIKNYVFMDSSYNYGTINGEVIFNDSSYNSYGTINGNITFNNNSYNSYGTLNGNVIFNTPVPITGTINGGTISGDFSTTGITINSGTVFSKISGIGSLTKSGNSTLILNNANSYSGGTFINEGTLQVNHTQALGLGDVINNATLDIGSTAVTINGNYIQNANSTLKVTIADNSYGKITATNQYPFVNENSTLILNITTAIAHNSTYTIIDGKEGGNSVGKINNIFSDSSMYTFVATGGEDLILLVLHKRTYSSIASGYAAPVGSILDKIITENPTGDMASVLDTLDSLTSDTEVALAIETMIPPLDRGVLELSLSSLNNFVGISLSRTETASRFFISEAPSLIQGVSSGDETKKETLSKVIWAKNYGSYLNQDKRKGIPGYTTWTSGMATGIDHLFNENFILGLSLGYGYGQINSKANSATTAMNSLQAGVYFNFPASDSDYFFNSAVSFAWNWYNGKRSIDIGNLHRVAQSDYEAQQSGIYLEYGYSFHHPKKLKLSPFVCLQYNYLHIEDYQETGADSLNLEVETQQYNFLQSGLGLKLNYPFKSKFLNCNFEFHTKWLYDFIGKEVTLTSRFTGGGESFVLKGDSPSRNSFNVGGKILIDLNKNLSLNIESDIETKDKFLSFYGSAKIIYRF